MYRMTVRLPNLTKLRDIPRKAQAIMRSRMQTEVKPVLQSEVDATLGKEPGKVAVPFRFLTDRSRRAYFATKGFGKGIPYIRTHQLATSWVVELSSQFIADAIKIYNSKLYAKYVYGSPTQLQTPGHRDTGWPDLENGQNQYITIIRAFAVVLVLEQWKLSVKEAVHS